MAKPCLAANPYSGLDSHMSHSFLPVDVYCGVPSVDPAEVRAFLDGVPSNFAVASEIDVPRDVVAVLGELERLAANGEMPGVYWSRGPAQGHHACGYNVSSLLDGGLVFGVGVLEESAERVRRWLSTEVAPRGTVVTVLERPPPDTYSALTSLVQHELLPPG